MPPVTAWRSGCSVAVRKLRIDVAGLAFVVGLLCYAFYILLQVGEAAGRAFSRAVRLGYFLPAALGLVGDFRPVGCALIGFVRVAVTGLSAKSAGGGVYKTPSWAF